MRGNKEKKKGRKKAAKYWIISMTATGVLVAFSTGKSHALSLRWFKEEKPAAVSNLKKNEGEAEEKFKFDIPANNLGVVLEEFQKITGWQVTIQNRDIENIYSPGVKGEFTAEQALKILLTDTGIIFKRQSSKSILLDIQGTNETVVIIATPEGQLSSPKYTASVSELPQTQTIISKETIRQQGATTLRDVLQNVSGLTITAGEGGAPAGDNLTLRGFSARNDIFVDGVRDLGPQSRDPFNLEQVEVVKGPSSAFTGRGSTGGSINLVSKTPTLQRFFNFSANFGTDETKRVTGDVNLPLERLGWGERTAFRLNFMAHDSAFPGREEVESKRWGIAPSFSFGIGKKTLVDASYFRLEQDNISDYGIPWVPATNNVLVEYRDRPAPVPRSTFYGLKNRDYEKTDADLFTLRLSHAFDENLNLRNQFRFGRGTRDSIATPPRFLDNDSTTIRRELRSWMTEDEIFDNQTDFTARFSTGKFSHSFVTGVELIREKNIRITRTNSDIFTTTLLNPNPYDVFDGVLTISPIVGDLTGVTHSLYAFDTIQLHPKFQISGGLRWDRFDVEGITTAGAPVDKVDKMLSFRASAIYKPVSFGTIYVSYGSSLNPSLEGLSYGAATNLELEPEKTFTYELGSKWDLLNRRLLLSGAIFRVDKNNARTPGILPGDPVQVLTGKQRVDGVELSVTGLITQNWNILSSYTFLDSEILRSNTPAEVGKRLINTPKNSFSLWTTYSFLQRFSFGGGTRFVDKRFGNNTNTRFVDAYWLIDATASYRVTKNLDLRLNMNNLTDKYYFDRVAGGHVVPGAGRAIYLITDIRF